MENERAIGAVRPDGGFGEAGPGIGEPYERRSERIMVGSGDENVAKVQLAARWAEGFAPADGDTLESMLHRFYRAYSYIDSVTHSVSPEEP